MQSANLEVGPPPFFSLSALAPHHAPRRQQQPILPAAAASSPPRSTARSACGRRPAPTARSAARRRCPGRRRWAAAAPRLLSWGPGRRRRPRLSPRRSRTWPWLVEEKYVCVFVCVCVGERARETAPPLSLESEEKCRHFVRRRDGGRGAAFFSLSLNLRFASGSSQRPKTNKQKKTPPKEQNGGQEPPPACAERRAASRSLQKGSRESRARGAAAAKGACA